MEKIFLAGYAEKKAEVIVKKLPIGIDDYRKVIEGGYLYVDKTLFIQEVVEKGTEVAIIPRPRRFGKTINMSMLKYFFEKSEEDNSCLFVPFKIWQTQYRDLQGKYPVIFFSLKGVQQETWDCAYTKLKTLIAQEFGRHRYLLDSPKLAVEEQSIFRAILQKEADQADTEESLKLLSIWLRRYHGTSVIVLIDEYDAPIHTAYFRGYYSPMISFMRNWLGEGLKSNAALERAVITGILRIAKESIFSDLNHASNFTIFRENFGDKFGFLENEVAALLLEHNMMDQLCAVRSWYNGYHIGPHAIYNPWSILQYLEQKKLEPYWVNTSANALIKEQITQKKLFLKEDFEHLLLGHSIAKVVDEGLVFADLPKKEEAIWSLLLFSGYLTLPTPPLLRGSKLSCTLAIPNQEILSLFQDIVEDYFKNDDSFAWQRLLKDLTDGNVEEFSILFKNLIMEIFSVYDLPWADSERVYHAFVLGLLTSLRDTHEVRSNRESGLGRYDVCLFPKDPKALGILMEFKKGKEGEDLDLLAEEALKQIQALSYTKELSSRGISKILLLGIAFQGKIVSLKGKHLK